MVNSVYSHVFQVFIIHAGWTVCKPVMQKLCKHKLIDLVGYMIILERRWILKPHLNTKLNSKLGSTTVKMFSLNRPDSLILGLLSILKSFSLVIVRSE